MRISKFIVVVIVFFGAMACDKKITDTQEEVKTFPVIKLQRQTASYDRDYVAEIVAHQYVELRSRIDGLLSRIHKDEGSYVKEGEVLFTLQNDRYLADLAIAEANRKNAVAQGQVSKLEVQQVKQLVEKGVVSELELKLAEAKYQGDLAKIEEAEYQRDNAKTLVAFSRIKAPFSGRIDRILLKRGSSVSRGELLTRLTDNSKIYAYFNLSEIDFLRYSRLLEKTDNAKEVSLILADGTPHTDKGIIETAESTIDETTGSLAIRAKFLNERGLLKHGSTGKIVLSTQLENALILPQKCTFDVQDRSYVFVYNTKTERLEQRRFRYSYRIDDFYVVKEGLIDGDIVLFSGLQEVKDGEKIKIDMQKYEPVILN